MARQRNPRRVVLDALRLLNRNTRTMVSRWDQAMTTYDKTVTRADGRSGDWRPLRDDEKNENNANEWQLLIEHMDANIRVATSVRDFAIRQRDELSG